MTRTQVEQVSYDQYLHTWGGEKEIGCHRILPNILREALASTAATQLGLQWRTETTSLTNFTPSSFFNVYSNIPPSCIPWCILLVWKCTPDPISMTYINLLRNHALHVYYWELEGHILYSILCYTNLRRESVQVKKWGWHRQNGCDETSHHFCRKIAESQLSAPVISGMSLQVS